MNYAVIDIGSNTVKCEVFAVSENKLKPIDFFSEQLGIIGRIENSVLSSADISLLCRTLNSFAELSKKYDAQIYCFATESLRRINNLAEVETEIKRKCALELEMLSGRDEALCSFWGFKAASPNINNGIMVDMGGGSTEILKFNALGPIELNSFKFGCLSLRRDYVKGRFPTKVEQKAIKRKVTEEISRFSWIDKAECLCFIGGTGSAIGKLAIELGYTNVPEFPIEIFLKLFCKLDRKNEETLKLLEKYIPARIETILPGMCGFRAILEKTQASTVYISNGGIRDGFLLNKLKEEKL